MLYFLVRVINSGILEVGQEKRAIHKPTRRMGSIGFRVRYNNLKRLSANVLKTTDEYSKPNASQQQLRNIENLTTQVVEIRNKWINLRSDMIRKYGLQNFILTPAPVPRYHQNVSINTLWQHWHISKQCIESIKLGLTKFKL